MITTMSLDISFSEYKFSQFSYVYQYSNLVTTSMQILHGNVAARQPCPFFFCAMLCSFVHSSCHLFNCSQFSSVNVAVIQLCWHVIDLNFTLVRILLYGSLLEITYCKSLGRNVQLNTSSGNRRTASEKEVPSSLIIQFSSNTNSKRRSFPYHNRQRWWF
jgi:uncharacterized protein Veg